MELMLSQNPTGILTYEKPVAKPTHPLGCPRDGPTPSSEAPTGKEGILGHLRGPSSLPLFSNGNREQAFQATSPVTKPALHPVQSHTLWLPRPETSRTAHPKDLARDSVLHYASQMVCSSLARLVANYRW